MKCFPAVAMLVVTVGTVLSAQTTYEIDPAHSSAEFSIKHMMVSNVRGELGKVTGTIVYDPANLSASSVQASIDATGITTRDAGRDKDLKSPHFFEVSKYPTITFRSTQLVEVAGKLQVKGNLTIHGVTRPVVLAIDGPSPDTKDPWGNFRRGATATTSLNRKDYGLVWNKTLDGGGVLVGDEVAITLDVEGVRKQGTSTGSVAVR